MWIKNNIICLFCVNIVKITKKMKFGQFGNDKSMRNIAIDNNAYGYAWES